MPPLPVPRFARARRGLLCLLASLAGAPAAWCALELPSLVRDHMVLQRDQPIRLSGRAEPGETVTLALASRTATVRAGADGRWAGSLEPLPAGGPHTLTVSAGAETRTLNDVLVGDVWFCAGQSNMHFMVERSDDAAREIAAARDPFIREFQVGAAEPSEPAETVRGDWIPASPETVGRFSAVAYFFARDYRKTHPDVPIGLIRSSWGGSVIESWMPRAPQEADTALLPIVRKIDAVRARYHADHAVYQEQRAAYAAAIKAGGTPAPEKPKAPARLTGYKHDVAALFNGMVYPLKDYALRGVVWYQGESNTGRPASYARQLELLIGEWRALWRRPDLPFVVVQLPRFGHPGAQSWPWLREAQEDALRLPGVALAVTIDSGSSEREVHPSDKQAVGACVALAVRRHVDGEAVAADGPVFVEARKEDGAVRLRFVPKGAGLAVRGGGDLTGFLIAGAGGEFVPAEARIEGDEVVVRGPAVPKPEAVRYAWSNLAEGNLVNAEGLPAAPFRTDRWPMKITRGSGAGAATD